MSTDPTINGDIPFEAALKELEGIAGRLERGDLTLEASLGEFERAAMLVRVGRQKLAEADKKIAELVVDDGGTLSFRPFEADAGT